MTSAAPDSSPRPLFLYGCPRSGTTWAQLLLACHPSVVTAPETHIFSFYINGFRRQWSEEKRHPENGQETAGLSQVLDEAQFRELCRTASDYVLDRIAELGPSARILVEKSPQHALQAEWIATLYPDALFLHVIRDPRDTVASLVAAGRTWGRSWAPANPIEAARYWKRHVESGRALSRLGEQYRELRFEGLRADAVAELEGVLAWLGLPADESFCRETVEACRLEKLRTKTRSPHDLPIPGSTTPKGFFRGGAVGGWQKELSPTVGGLIEHIAGDLMDELGYQRSGSLSLAGQGRMLIHDALARARESVDWQLQRLLQRV